MKSDEETLKSFDCSLWIIPGAFQSDMVSHFDNHLYGPCYNVCWNKYRFMWVPFSSFTLKYIWKTFKIDLVLNSSDISSTKGFQKSMNETLNMMLTNAYQSFLKFEYITRIVCWMRYLQKIFVADDIETSHLHHCLFEFCLWNNMNKKISIILTCRAIDLHVHHTRHCWQHKL